MNMNSKILKAVAATVAVCSPGPTTVAALSLQRTATMTQQQQKKYENFRTKHAATKIQRAQRGRISVTVTGFDGKSFLLEFARNATVQGVKNEIEATRGTRAAHQDLLLLSSNRKTRSLEMLLQVRENLPLWNEHDRVITPEAQEGRITFRSYNRAGRCWIYTVVRNGNQRASLTEETLLRHNPRPDDGEILKPEVKLAGLLKSKRNAD